ncbi:mannitol-1-phosphate 5-dehydrogenase [Paenibacillus tuaregi]|uniref:mannitol-1-phosphate 5-dehydrogenase n=1 Tax=Paenibacillus tuaregi TaxID=1816681 RepID=UPI0008389993|nr:mannitol-1-phosphate 5-dehydrogenase [Paenibacillus tuaregi]
MRAVHFGAGNIGRGFIGLLLSQSGYEVIFSDVNETLVSELKRRGEYTVTLANDAKDALPVTGVTAIDGKNLKQVAEAVAEADLVTTAVGVGILKHIAQGIAQGIELRLQSPNARPLHVIACENAIGGSAQLKEQVYAHLSEKARAKAGTLIAFPNAAVDRIVPLQHHEDPLQVVVEPFYEWVVDRSQMIEGFHEVGGVHYVDQLEPYIERKLFTVNTGHCTAAYFGHLAGYNTIQEAMADEAVEGKVRAVLEETGAMLVAKHGFDKAEHQKYILKILDRFRNPSLTDEVVRVGRSPIRKLSPNDRLVSPARQALEYGIRPKQLTAAMGAALHFDYAEDPEAVELQSSIRELGIGETVTKYTAISADQPLHQDIVKMYQQLG